jgi:hypothetical protein
MATRTELQEMINAIASGKKNTALGVRTVLNALADSVFVKGDVKEIHCTNEYLVANFDDTGLGINERVGWAISNGKNGTFSRGGLVAVAYQRGVFELGDTGGSADAVVISHKHNSIEYQNGRFAGNTMGTGKGALVNDLVGNDGDQRINETSATGESGVGKNMQPYIVVLVIEKL